MKKSVRSLLAAFCCLLAASASAQYYTEDDKKEGKIKMKAFCDNEPGFNATTVPDKWKSESAVVLFQKYEYTFLEKYKNIEYEETYRRRIKLLDKAAVEDFSKFYWNNPEKQTGQQTLFTDNSNKFYMQINVIKANGTVVEVSLKDAIDVNANDYKNLPKFYRSTYTNRSKKLAIPNLEPGDIIDYFYYKRMYATNKYTSDFGDVTLSLGEVYPIVEQKYGLVMENDFYVKMNTYNGAPKVVSKSEKYVYGGLKADDKVMVYTINDKDREKFADEPWSYELVTQPLLRFHVTYLVGPSKDGRLKGEKGVLKDKFTSEELIEHFQNDFKSDLSAVSSATGEPLNHLKTVMPKEKDVKKICDELYYAIRFFNLNNAKKLETDYTGPQGMVMFVPIGKSSSTVDLKKYYETFTKDVDNLRARVKTMETALKSEKIKFSNDELEVTTTNYYDIFGSSIYITSPRTTFAKCLEKLKIPYKVLLVPERQYGKIEDVLFPRQYTPVIMVEDAGKKYYTYGFGYHSTPDVTDYDLEGAEAIAYNPATFKKDKKIERIRIPVSTSDFNKLTTKTTVAFNPTAFESTILKREIAVHGDYKDDYEYLNYINDSCDFQDMRYYIKDFNKKFKPKVLKNFQSKEEEMKKLLPQYASLKNQVTKAYHKQSIEDDYSIDKIDTIIVLNNGRIAAKGDVLFKDQLRVKEMATKLGPNFSINIGKVIGDQATIEPKYMKDRKTDVNFAFARTIEHEITFEIPAGYKAEGIKDLNSTVDNDAASFISTAEQVGNNIVIKTKKVYKHNFEKKENWQKIADMLTAAYNFSQKKIILKKA